MEVVPGMALHDCFGLTVKNFSCDSAGISVLCHSQMEQLLERPINLLKYMVRKESW